jgi:hypothetical protein
VFRMLLKMSSDCFLNSGNQLIFVMEIRHVSFRVRGSVPWLRRLVAGLTPRRPVFAPGSAHVEYVVDKATM